MKKLFLLLPAVMAVFALVFTSCEAAVNPGVVTAGYTKIEDPAVKATTFPGAILVSWLPVKDAKSYVVTRRDNTTGQIKRSTGASNQWNGANADNGGDASFFVLDVMSVSDELVNGRSYTYSVIAANSNGIDGADSQKYDIVLNGKTEATVSARVPADYAVPAITDVKTTQIVDASDGSDWVKITWKAGDYNPAVKSTVTYSYGTAQDLGDGTDAAGSFKITVGGAGDANAGQKGDYTALVPVIGGDNAITISNTFGDGRYYAAGDNATKTVTHTGSKSNLGKIIKFAANSAIPVDGKPAVPLQYQGLNTRGNFDTAAVEKLYRAEIVGKTGVNSSFLTGNTVANWTAVVDLVWTTQATGPTTGLRTALDTTVVAGTSYAYTLVLDKAGVKSNPSTANVDTGTVSTVTLPKIDFDFTGGGVSPYSTVEPTGIFNGVALRITWIGEQGADYRLYRAPNIGTHDHPWPGTWTEVTARALTASVADGKIIYNDTTAATRTEWYYQVIATKGTTKGTLTNTALAPSISGTPPPYSTHPWNASSASYTSALGITRPSAAVIRFAPTGIAAILPSTEIFPGESLVVYYRPPDAQYTTTSLSVGYDELTAVPAGREIISPRTATLDAHKLYSYSVYIKTAGGVLLAVGDETDL